MSWFSGKKFRRVRCENINELIKSTKASEDIVRLLKESPPILCFTRIDKSTFHFTLQADDKYYHITFKLGEENEFQRRDGSKIKVTYRLVGDNIMKQTIKMPDGKTAYFTRVFSETESKMTVELEGTDVKATIYYEVVE